VLSLRKILTTTGLAAAVVLGTVNPAAAAPAAAAAKGGGSVANSCAVIAPVQIWKKTDYAKGTQGVTIEDLPCGQGASGVWRLTVKGHPFYVKRPGRAPFCMDAGQFFYPANAGIGHETVVTPTVSCSNGRAS
jgi:hypothetical protein